MPNTAGAGEPVGRHGRRHALFPAQLSAGVLARAWPDRARQGIIPVVQMVEHRGAVAWVRSSTFRVAVLAALLLAAMEAMLAVSAVLTAQFSGIAPFLVDWLAKLPWGVVVCAGLWLGLEAGGYRPYWAALAGLLAPPAASLVARASAEALHGFPFAGLETSALSPFLVAGVRAVEYGCLGLCLAWLARRGSPAWLHAGLGLLVGMAFGLVVLALTAGLTAESLAGTALVKWAVNELVFPAGVALVVFNVREQPVPA